MSTLENDIETVRELVQRQEGCPDPTCYACKSNRKRGEAAERVIEMAQQTRTVEIFLERRIERLVEALQKIDAVTVDTAHFTHSGMQHAAVEQIDDALEDVRDLIGPAPEAPPVHVAPDQRTEADKARTAEVQGVSTYAQLLGRSKRSGEDT